MRRAIRPARAWRHAAMAATVLVPLLAAGAGAPAARADGPGGQISVTARSNPPALVEQGAQRVPLLTLTLTASGGLQRVSRVEFVAGGTAPERAVASSGLRLWRDVNGNGVADGPDLQIASASVLDTRPSLAPNLDIWWYEAQQVVVTADIAEAAPPGGSFQLTLPNMASIRTVGEGLIAAAFPLETVPITIAGPAETGLEDAATSADAETISEVTLEAAGITASVPASAAPPGLSLQLTSQNPAAFPQRPGTPQGGVYKVNWSGASSDALASPIRIYVDLDTLGADPAAALQIVVLDENGAWRAVPAARSADGTEMIFSVSVSTTFSIVELDGAGSGLVAPSGGRVASAGGDAWLDVPADASDTPIQASFTPVSAAAAPISVANAAAAAAPVRVTLTDPVTGERAVLAQPGTLRLPMPSTASLPSCAAGCSLLAFGQPAGGGPPVPLPTHLSDDGTEVLVKVSVDMEITLFAGPNLAAGSVSGGSAASIVTPNGHARLRTTADSGPAQTGIALAPALNSGEPEGGLAADPLQVLYQSPGGRAPAAPAVLELSRAALDPGVDPTQVLAVGLPNAAPGGEPVPLAVIYDPIGRKLRIAIDISLTIYLMRDGRVRAEALNPGWNLTTFSGPDALRVEELAALLGDGVTQIARWDATEDGYQAYVAARAARSARFTVADEEPVWVMVSQPAPLIWLLPGDAPPPRNAPLLPGWNLISWSGPAASSADALAGIAAQYGTAYLWDPEAQRMVSVAIANGPSKDLPVAERGVFWVYVHPGPAGRHWAQPGR